MYKREKGTRNLKQFYESLSNFKGEDTAIEWIYAIDEFHSYSCNLVFTRKWDDWNDSYIYFNIIVDGNYVDETEKISSTEDFEKLKELFYNVRFFFNEKLREWSKQGNRNIITSNGKYDEYIKEMNKMKGEDL